MSGELQENVSREAPPLREEAPRAAMIGADERHALDTFVYAQAALHGLISMGLRLNEAVEGMAEPKQDGLVRAPNAGIIRPTRLISSNST